MYRCPASAGLGTRLPRPPTFRFRCHPPHLSVFHRFLGPTPPGWHERATTGDNRHGPVRYQDRRVSYPKVTPKIWAGTSDLPHGDGGPAS